MKILIINGPNLNLLGTREPDKYGSDSLNDIEKYLTLKHSEVSLTFFQSNIEGEIVNEIQSSLNSYNALVINPAAYSHTSVAIYDALKVLDIPIIEVHLTNTHSREDFRQKLVTARAATAVIAGLGKEGYSFALDYLKKNKGIYSEVSDN